jgi:hypothetical protein
MRPLRHIAGHVALVLLVTGLVLHPVTASTAEAEPNLTFNQAHGLSFEGPMTLNGTATFSLRTASWSIVDIGGATPVEVLTGPHLTLATPISDGHFTWSLEINVTGLNCVCYIEVLPGDSVDTDRPFRLVAYLGDMPDRHPVLFSESPGTPLAGNSDGIPITNRWFNFTYQLVTFSDSWNGSYITATVCEAPEQVCLAEPQGVSVSSSANDSQVSFKFDAEGAGLNDGVWRMSVRAVDPLLRSSNPMDITFVLDSTEPLVDLTGPTVVNERETILIQATVDDGYVGSTTTSTWTLRQPDTSVRGLTADERINEHHVSLELNGSGTYELLTTVVDRAGLVTTAAHVFVVENIRPEPVLTVDGLVLTDGQQIRVGPEPTWNISADEITDNEPVDFLWVIDNTTSVRSVAVLNASSFERSGMHQVELIVFDDDGSTNSIVVNLLILEPALEPTSTNTTVLWGGVMIIIVLMGGFLIMVQREQTVSDLPKWRSTPPQTSQDEDESSNG